MGKTQKYTDDQLLEAVIRYAEHYKGKIMLSKLAEWTAKNMEGMEEIKSYMFSRAGVVTDANGNTRKTERPCTVRINQINAMRSVSTAIKSNPLLRSANLETFFQLPLSDQRQYVLDTREQVEQLAKRNQQLTSESDIMQTRIQEILNRDNELENMLADIQERQKLLDKRVNWIINAVDLEERTKALASMGVENGGFNLNTYRQGLSEDLKHAFSIKDAISRSEKMLSKCDTDEKIKEIPSDDNIDDMLFGGINFEE